MPGTCGGGHSAISALHLAGRAYVYTIDQRDAPSQTASLTAMRQHRASAIESHVCTAPHGSRPRWVLTTRIIGSAFASARARCAASRRRRPRCARCKRLDCSHATAVGLIPCLAAAVGLWVQGCCRIARRAARRRRVPPRPEGRAWASPPATAMARGGRARLHSAAAAAEEGRAAA